MTQSHLFIAALLASAIRGIKGYAIAQPITKPSTTALKLPEIDLRIMPETDARISPTNDAPATFLTNKNKHFGVAHVNKPSRSTYDLGLGKNKPVVQTRAFTALQARTELDTTQAVMHLTEYESARVFPSPLTRVEAEFEKVAPTKLTRKIMPINPIRFVEDSLPVVPGAPQRSTLPADSPVMVQKDSSKLDVNTVWVEMLIHSEQRKFATATAN